jgi:hypothetical protein
MVFERTTVVLGPEWDIQLRDRLLEVLRGMGTLAVEKAWGIGGSQEFEAMEVRIGDDVLVVEAETYIGLSISGAKNVVDRVQEVLGRTGPSVKHKRTPL